MPIDWAAIAAFLGTAIAIAISTYQRSKSSASAKEASATAEKAEAAAAGASGKIEALQLQLEEAVRARECEREESARERAALEERLRAQGESNRTLLNEQQTAFQRQLDEAKSRAEQALAAQQQQQTTIAALEQRINQQQDQIAALDREKRETSTLLTEERTKNQGLTDRLKKAEERQRDLEREVSDLRGENKAMDKLLAKIHFVTVGGLEIQPPKSITAAPETK